jgi:hypothetical protein
MAKMNSSTRLSIVNACKTQGFDVQLKSDGSDEYDKNLVFWTGKYPSKVFIHRDTGINSSSGNLSYLKVAVHPAHFRDELVDPSNGIEDFLNNRTKINRHASSNYRDFPRYSGNDEPCGKCYKIHGLIALERLLAGLKKTTSEH